MSADRSNSQESIPCKRVLGAFCRAESMLLEVLRIVPYCKEHCQVWSPVLATVLMEACSQLDSLWKARSRLGDSKVSSRDLDIQDYFCKFGAEHANRWVVFFQDDGELLYPFAAWRCLERFEKDAYQPVAWWSAYNDVKHDRLLYENRATIDNALNALAGLFLAIIRTPGAYRAMSQAGWFEHNARFVHPEWLASEEDTATLLYLTIESEVFAYALGWGKANFPPGCNSWGGYVGSRFTEWFPRYSLSLAGSIEKPADT